MQLPQSIAPQSSPPQAHEGSKPQPGSSPQSGSSPQPGSIPQAGSSYAQPGSQIPQVGSSQPQAGSEIPHAGSAQPKQESEKEACSTVARRLGALNSGSLPSMATTREFCTRSAVR